MIRGRTGSLPAPQGTSRGRREGRSAAAAITWRGAVAGGAVRRVRQPPEQEARRLAAHHAHHGGAETGADAGVGGVGVIEAHGGVGGGARCSSGVGARLVLRLVVCLYR